MRRINLLPPEQRRGAGLAIPGDGMLGILLILFAVLLLIMVALYVFYLFRLNNIEDDISKLDQQIAQQNARIAELQPYQNLENRLEAKKPVADGIYASQFLWANFFQGLAFVIPSSTSLSSLTAKASPINIEASPGDQLEPPGSVSFTGLALPGYQNTADFVVQVNTLNSVANTRLNSAKLDQQTFTRNGINFDAQAELITTVGEDGTEVPIDGTGSAGQTTSVLQEGAISPSEGGP